MDLNEDTKNGPEQKQLDVLQQESPRKCKVCGGPNHYGCGCEAKQLREAKEAGLTENEAKALQEPEPQPASEDEILERVFSPEAIAESDSVNKQMAKDIKTMADGFEGLCACMYDTNNYLKVMAGDLITIRKFLSNEDEVKNAAPAKRE